MRSAGCVLFVFGCFCCVSCVSVWHPRFGEEGDGCWLQGLRREMLKTSLCKSPDGRIVRLLSQVTDSFVYWLPGFSQWFWLPDYGNSSPAWSFLHSLQVKHLLLLQVQPGTDTSSRVLRPMSPPQGRLQLFHRHLKSCFSLVEKTWFWPVNFFNSSDKTSQKTSGTMAYLWKRCKWSQSRSRHQKFSTIVPSSRLPSSWELFTSEKLKTSWVTLGCESCNRDMEKDAAQVGEKQWKTNNTVTQALIG